MQIYTYSVNIKHINHKYCVHKHYLTFARFRVHYIVMKKESWALLLSSVAVLISLVAICVACPHKAELGFDYQGVIVGVLSLLVTILIGWQIYSMIDAKNVISNIRKEVEFVAIAADRQAHQLSAAVYGSLADFYRYKDEFVYEYFYNSLLALKHHYDLKDIGACNAFVRVLNQRFPVNKHISNLQKSMLLNVMESIKDYNTITNMETLRNNIILFPSK